MGFLLKYRQIGRLRVGLAVYYNVAQFEKTWRRKHTPTANGKSAGK
jgi:hypothetical protein